MKKLDQLRNNFSKSFETTNETLLAVSAPGRVNLIGEHTDYNDGFVFPVAIDKTIDVMAQKTDGDTVTICAVDVGETRSFNIDSDLAPAVEHTWLDYPRGIIALLKRRYPEVSGMQLTLQGNVPRGAGVSSSAAVEVATGFAVKELFGLDLTMKQLALLCQQAEKEFAGVNCGIMDQFASALCQKGCALLLDCRTQETRNIALPTDNFSLIITNTMVKRGLVDSEYNTRRSECEQAVQWLKKMLLGKDIKALRDVTREEWSSLDTGQIPEKPRMRAQHVITENQRVLDAVTALKESDIEQLGQILYQGHNSLRDDYEVTIEELDVLVRAAEDSTAAWGARMTGAGFGGCTISLVKPGREEEFCAFQEQEYLEETGRSPEFYLCAPSPGAHRIL